MVAAAGVGDMEMGDLTAGQLEVLVAHHEGRIARLVDSNEQIRGFDPALEDDELATAVRENREIIERLRGELGLFLVHLDALAPESAAALRARLGDLGAEETKDGGGAGDDGDEKTPDMGDDGDGGVFL